MQIASDVVRAHASGEQIMTWTIHHQLPSGDKNGLEGFHRGLCSRLAVPAGSSECAHLSHRHETRPHVDIVEVTGSSPVSSNFKDEPALKLRTQTETRTMKPLYFASKNAETTEAMVVTSVVLAPASRVCWLLYQHDRCFQSVVSPPVSPVRSAGTLD